MKLLKNFILEMPERIYLTDPSFGLDNIAYNSRLVSTILNSSNTKLVKSYPKGNLYKFGNRLFLIENDTIIYCLIYKIVYHKFLNKYVLQELLHYRNKSISGYDDLTFDVFFNILLPKYHYVMTDHLHTEDSEKFWVRIIKHGLENNYNCYYLNFSTKTITKCKNIFDFYYMLEYDDIWGDHKRHNSKRMLISDIDILNK